MEGNKMWETPTIPQEDLKISSQETKRIISPCDNEIDEDDEGEKSEGQEEDDREKI